jgi:antirestriction protein ArdC/phage/plasmid primase-like uncharacterized protein
MAEAKSKKPFHEVVADNLIAQLKEGTAPWQKPWNPGAPGAALPMNPTTGKRYRGINAIHLMAQGHGDQRWMTYKQATAANAQVRKGEKGTLVQYWKFNEERVKRNEDGSIVIGKDDKPVKEVVQLERPKVFNAVVFNAEQIDGLPPQALRQDKSWNSIDRAEEILKASGADIRHDQQDRAFYRPSTDSIHLPQKEAFPSADRYYATALHELGHWTGNAKRLDRDLAHPFGSEGYAKEELRAEISSMILGDELGIGHDPSQHVAYVKSWIKALQDDPLEIFRAAADAEKIQGYVLGLEQQQTQQQPVTLAQTQREKEHAEVKASLVTPHPQFGSEKRDSAAVLEQTANEAGYSAYFSWSENESGGHDIRVNYEDSSGKTLAVHSELLGDGKVLTCIGNERVPGTGFTAEPDWQRDALKTAFASMDNNLTLAAKNVRDQVEKISGDPRELPEDVKFPKNWGPDSSFLASNNNVWGNSQAVAEADMSTKTEIRQSPEQQRRERAEKFILSNLDGSLPEHIQNMNRRQLALAAEVLNEALKSAPKDEFWQRNDEFTNSFSQDWHDTHKHLRKAALDIDSELSKYPAKQYVVIDESQESHSIVLETNSAMKAMAAVEGNSEHYIRDTTAFNNARVNLDDSNSSFISTLNAERDAINNGLIKADDEIQIIPANEAADWYQYNLENIMERSETPEEMRSGIASLGPEPAENEAVFFSDNGSRILPQISQNIAQENTPINVPFKERNEAKTLGAKWDRNEQTWYVPQGVSLDKFTKWTESKVVTVSQVASASVPEKEISERQNLAVPYKDREEAKAAGAKWDKNKKTWYAEAGADMEKLAKWKPENVKLEQSPAMTLNEEVENALKSVGCILDADTDQGRKHPIMDGEGHRITVEGDKKGEKSGFYVIHTDGHPAGFMQNNRTKEELRWSSKGYVQTDEEKALLRAQAAQKQADKAERQQQTHEASANRVGKQLSSLSEPQQPTVYMENKGLGVHKGVFTDKEGQKTYIPAYDAQGKQWTMQYINEDGTKRFAKDARKEGCFHVVGGLESLKDAPVLIIAEGYATAGSITEATNNPVVAAFDSGNLEPVAKALKEAYPNKPIIIAGDDDIAQSCKMKVKGKDTVNVGREKATEAAKAVGGVAVFPVFAKGEVPGKDELGLIKPAAYLAHQSAMRKLENHASGDKPLSDPEIKILESAKLSDKQLEILHRAERHTDFNDLDRNSSFGREGVAMQMKAVISDQLSKHQALEKTEVKNLVQEKEKKRTIRHAM